MNRKLVIIFMFTIFLLGIMELIISGLIEMISSDLNISYGLTGQLITVYAVSFAVFGPLLIQLTEKFTQKKTILYSFLIFCCSLLIKLYKDCSSSIKPITSPFKYT